MTLKKRLGILGIGLSVNWLLVWIFDFALYPLIIYVYGILRGGIVMTILSFFVCYASILFYDWTKKDWIGIETLKGIKELEPKNKVGKFITKLIRNSDPLAIIILSIQFDPFITVAYLRHGAHQYNGLSKRDWRIFFGSLLIGNVYWTLVSFTGVSIVEVLWRLCIGFLH